MGVDLGQARDYTAIVVVERRSAPEGPDEYHVRYCERLPLGTSYEAVTQHIGSLLRPFEDQKQTVVLVVDATGVGRAVVDAMRDDGLKPIPMIIHSGSETTKVDGAWHVPKRDLVAVPKVLLGKKQLKIKPEIPFADVLINETLNFRAKTNNAGHDSYEAWREGDHDDLVFALSLACWCCRRRKKGVHGIAPITRKMGPRDEREERFTSLKDRRRNVFLSIPP
jgi:hypothetical protein